MINRLIKRSTIQHHSCNVTRQFSVGQTQGNLKCILRLAIHHAVNNLALRLIPASAVVR